jgi:hypothetical protein
MQSTKDGKQLTEHSQKCNHFLLVFFPKYVIFIRMDSNPIIQKFFHTRFPNLRFSSIRKLSFLYLVLFFINCGFEKPSSIKFLFPMSTAERASEQPIINDPILANTLSSLLTNQGSLYPPFSPDTNHYTLTLSSGTTSLALTPTTSDPESTISINGVPINSGTLSPSIALQTGSNTITIIVRTRNGVENTYTILANVVTDYLVKVNISGLVGTINLNSNSDSLAININGIFAFPSSRVNGSLYSLEIISKPTTQFCAITSSPNNNLPYGTINNSDVLLEVECKNGYLYNGTVYQVFPIPTIPSLNQLTTMAGNYPTRSSGFTDDIGNLARFNNPIAIATDGNSIFVADIFNDRIRKLEIATNTVTTLSTIIGPHGIATDGIFLYVSSFSNHTIVRVPVTGGSPLVIAGGVQGNLDETGTNARFNVPTYLTTDGKNLYITDRGNNQIRKYSIATGVVSTIVTGLNGPNGITTDSNFLYIANTEDNNILRYDLNLGGPADIFATGLTSPYGLTMDGSNLYVFEGSGKSIKKITKTSASISTLISAVGYQDGLLSGTAQICTIPSPCDSSLTTDGNFLFIADRHNHSIRKIGP